MDRVDPRRRVLTRAVRERDWCVDVASEDGQILKELEMFGWVELTVDGFCYRHVVTERGLERHVSWGDERRESRRSAPDSFQRPA